MLDNLSSKDRFNFCLVNTRFTSLVHSFARFRLDLREKYLKYISLVLQISIESQADDEFNGLFKQHADVKSLDLQNSNSETLNYISQFCPGLEHLKIKLYTTYMTDLEKGFGNLEKLELVFDLKTQNKYNCAVIKNITALPKLRVLKIENYYLEDIIGFEKWSKMEKLESLEMMYVSQSFAYKMIKCSSKTLTNILVKNINDTNLNILLDNCPNLTSVGFHTCEISQDGFRLFFKMIGRQLEYLHLKETEFTCQDFIEILNLKSTNLKAFDLGYYYTNEITSQTLINFLEQYGGQLKRLNLDENSGLTDEVLSVAVEKCPFLIQQGEWNLDGWESVTPDGLSNFMKTVGTSLKVFTAPFNCFNDGQLEELANNCPNLHSLEMTGYDIEDVAALARNLGKFRGIHIV